MICNLCKLYKCRFKSVPFPTFLFHSLSKVCKDFGNLQKSLRRLVVWSVTDSDYWLFCSISVHCCWPMHKKPNPTFREELTFAISKNFPTFFSHQKDQWQLCKLSSIVLVHSTVSAFFVNWKYVLMCLQVNLSVAGEGGEWNTSVVTC